MTTEQVTKHTRRAVIGAALGGAAAVAAQSMAPLVARAAQDDPVLAGHTYTATAVTSLENTTDGQVSVAGVHNAAGTGVSGTSATQIGVLAKSTDTTPVDPLTADPALRRAGAFGVAGSDATVSGPIYEAGVFGFADTSLYSTGVWGQSQQGNGVVAEGDWGIYAFGTSLGVAADVPSGAIGVFGFTGNTEWPTPPTTGVGVWAAAGSTSDVALQVTGKAKFSRSARVSISSTATSKKVTMAGVTSSSYVIATLQTSVSGCYVRAVVCSSGYFTIYLSKAPGKTVYAGYMVIN
jgi:hypothetical protein